ncbi:MAG: alpha/beta family hydrolase [Cyclobacteriaceae bacterium]
MPAFKLKISELYGEVSCEVSHTPSAKYILMLAHGAGAGMDHSFLQKISQALTELHAVVVRFNFPYKEQGKKFPGSVKPNIMTIRSLSIWCGENYPNLPLFLAGKSYGGRMISHFIAEDKQNDVRGLIYFGFPLHAAGKPDTKRADHLHKIKIPQLFLQGTNDALADFELIRKVTANLPLATLIPITNADHSFKIPKKEKGKSPDEVIDYLAGLAIKWITSS